jgi:hypothetical protein
MSLLHDTQLTVWFEQAVPYGLVFEGRHYRVTDTPTRLEDEVLGTTHPLPVTGWRFQATDDDDRARMFVIHRRGDGGWVLARVYD